ncbi:MAG: DNA polymerase III subunit delta [Balneolaceae bacterium]
MARKTSIEHFRTTLRSIREETLRKSVYYLYGGESFFLDLLQDEVMKLVPDDQKDFNSDLLYGSEVTPDRVLGIARSFPMMADLRVVVVRDFRNLRGYSNEDGRIDDIIPYLTQPNPSTVLLLTDEKPPDKRTSLGKALTGKSGHIYSQVFEKLPDYKLPDWVSDWVSHKYRKRIAPEACQILTQLVGNDLQLLSTEIDKVCTFIDTEEEVKAEHIKTIVGSYREYTVIELKEAVINRNLENALGIMEQMLLKSNTDTGEVIRTVGFFYSVFGNIWKIRRLIEKGMDKSRVQQEMGISNNWFFNQLWTDASRYRLSEMPQIFEALLDADRAIKGFSTLDTSTIFLLLIKRITG